MVPDYDLVDQVLAGNAAAFEPLVARYQDALYAFLRSRLPAADAAEDVAQDTFLAAYSKLGALQDPNRFGAWLFGIARRKVQLFFRQRSRRPQASAEIAVEDLPAPELGRDPGAVLEALLTGLSDDQRVVLILRFRDGLNYREISDRLDLPLGTVGTLLHRARALIKARNPRANEAAL